jgi:hypothetical protein
LYSSRREALPPLAPLAPLAPLLLALLLAPELLAPELLALEYLPDAQLRHSSAPSPALNRPGAQAAQASDPNELRLPRGHSAQVLRCEPEEDGDEAEEEEPLAAPPPLAVVSSSLLARKDPGGQKQWNWAVMRAMILPPAPAPAEMLLALKAELAAQH